MKYGRIHSLDGPIYSRYSSGYFIYGVNFSSCQFQPVVDKIKDLPDLEQITYLLSLNLGEDNRQRLLDIVREEWGETVAQNLDAVGSML